MKGLLFALLATLVGLAMVGGGVYGLIQGDDDDSASASTSAAAPGFPLATDEDCEPAARRDPRLRTIRNLELQPYRGRAGTADVDPICNGESVTLTIRLAGMRARGTYSYGVELSDGAGETRNIGSMIGSNDTAFGSGTIGPDVQTRAYDQIIITRGKFGEIDPDRPKKVVFSGSL